MEIERGLIKAANLYLCNWLENNELKLLLGRHYVEPAERYFLVLDRFIDLRSELGPDIDEYDRGGAALLLLLEALRIQDDPEEYTAEEKEEAREFLNSLEAFRRTVYKAAVLH